MVPVQLITFRTISDGIVRKTSEKLKANKAPFYARNDTSMK
jgi:hypothetical protein